jgi:surface antigen
MNKPVQLCFIALCVIFASSIARFSLASSLNTSFLSHSPVSFFTKEDWKLSKAALQQTLEQYQDGVKVLWKNPQSGNYGTFLPTHTTRLADGGICRDVTIMNMANKIQEDATFKFCKFRDAWKIV